MKVQVITSEKLLWSPVSPTTALAMVALADAFMACTSLILFLIANTSQPVSQQHGLIESRFKVGPAWTQRFRQIRWTIHTQFTECKQTDKVKDLPWLTSRKFFEEGGMQVRTQLAYLFPDNLHCSRNWRAPRPTSSELQVPPGDVSHKCANLKAGVYIISIVEFSAIYGMVAVKHTYGLQENGVQKCVLQLPSHTLILTLDTDLEKDTPIIPVFFCLWIQFPPHKMCSTKTITNIKYHFFLLINHFSWPHWQLSSLFLIITFQNMFPF